MELQNQNLQLKIELAKEERNLTKERRQLMNKEPGSQEPSSKTLPKPSGQIVIKQNLSELSETFCQENNLSMSADTQAFTTIKTNFHGILNDNGFLRKLDSNANGTLSGIRQFFGNLAQLPPNLKQSGAPVWIKFCTEIEMHKNVLEDIRKFNNSKELAENLKSIHAVLVTLYDICRPSSNVATLSRILLWCKLESVNKVVGTERLNMTKFNLEQHQKNGSMKALFAADSARLNVWKQLSAVRSETRSNGYNDYRGKPYHKEDRGRGGGRGRARGGRGRGNGSRGGGNRGGGFKSEGQDYSDQFKTRQFFFENIFIVNVLKKLVVNLFDQLY